MFRFLSATLGLLAISCTSLVSSAQETAEPQTLQLEAIAAIVNDTPISFTDVRQRARMLLLSLGGQQPTQEQIEQITAQALDQLIDEKLQLQEAAEYEVEVSDSDIAGSIESLASQSGITRDVLLGTLLQAGINPTSLEEQTRADIAWRRIMGGLYGSRIRISENQIREQLNRLRMASEKEQYLLSEIFLYAPDAETRAQAVTAARSILQQLQAGAPFEVAAQRFSSAPTAATGGDMSWVTLDTLDETRANAVKALAGSGITAPLEVESGVYIMSVRGKREPAERTSRVDLIRVSVRDGSDAALLAAAQEMESCDGAAAVADADANVDIAEIEGLNINELGPEGQSLVLATDVGSYTEVFATSGTLAVMYVCNRQDDVEDMPTPAQVEDRLYSQQLGMISERSLRNLRREATIIRN